VREIKFRAWDKNTKEMYHWGDWEQTEWIKDAMPEQCGDEWTEQCILMQYTGLKDKNEKEIYEGDIVQECSDISPNDYQNRIGKIVYEKNIASFMVYVEKGYCHLNEGDWTKGDNLEYTKIIGNIYEHPHLLEDNPSTT
jgi:uncharacterized phage protein (TIGR01671 family)